ncbi:HNH endonuclease signature motif containing protein [Jeotgalicoccus sp. ATCC 8456]|uniref:HNH endonuclease signature motif containing protein n=1 Tax=Jeotgalicoccus sp. ATCC 8456 TaxID=946435 RepID=UPI0018E5DEF5|nr:HNH endonuclease signature motif containing protein [Jeotgalicoccus sp. ATCC 8456]QQD84764.1 HNH endonuclease [Jeotgalicoccus sp. ATCC 8456]
MEKISDILDSENLKKVSTIYFNLEKNKSAEELEFEEHYSLSISYRNSKFLEKKLDKEIVGNNNSLMRDYTDLDFEIKGSSTHFVKLHNDIKIERNKLLEKLFSKMQRLRFDYSQEDFREIIITSIFCFRGSQDFTGGYYAVDIIEDNISNQYIKDITSLLISLEDSNQLNLNFRELQPEYIQGKSRNSQLRINLRWFYERYRKNLYGINRYKYEILKSNSMRISTINLSNSLTRSFMERILFYQENILGRKDFMNILSPKQMTKEIEKLRLDLEFDYENIEKSDYVRNATIVNIANATLPDECSSCKNEYSIENRSFLLRDSNRHYLEIHHVISFGSDRAGDVLENLVKLCPTCHRALTPKRANVNYQKNIISNILNNSPTAENYVKNFVANSNRKEDLIEFVYNKLK